MSFRTYVTNLSLILCIFGSSISYAQGNLSQLLKKYNTESIPYITVQELALPNEDAILLDARESKEYNTSHLENAIYVGYDFFDINVVTENITDKSTKIVVYCSLGIRSEDVAEQLKKEGYTNVYNLFGGIFEWKNNDFTVFDNNNEPTEDVHTFSKEWSQWLLKGNKIYD
ncbi:rhodanese-like domain-containing protein [Winogradskyella sp.]|uniref:rhodanese-like domain-containing protein n=1 Tax=Winogradskyella sp. TaxID=1883156 RepID=UPI0026250B32|nr:rhodanese-like domain-containing protein [Winogradskyella sp.]